MRKTVLSFECENGAEKCWRIFGSGSGCAVVLGAMSGYNKWERKRNCLRGQVE